MVAKKIGWYVLLFGVILGIIDYFGIFEYLTNKPVEPFNFSSWILTPIFWAVVALIIIGAVIVKFGREESSIPRSR